MTSSRIQYPVRQLDFRGHACEKLAVVDLPVLWAVIDEILAG